MPVDLFISNTIKSDVDCCVAVAARVVRFHRMMGNVLSLTGNERSSFDKGCFAFTFIRHKHLFAPSSPLSPLSLFSLSDVTRWHFYDNILLAEHTDIVDSDWANLHGNYIRRNTEPSIHIGMYMRINSEQTGTGGERNERFALWSRLLIWINYNLINRIYEIIINI